MLDEFEATMDKQHTEAAIDLAATQKAQRAAETGKSSPCKTQAQDEATEEAEGSGEQVVDSVETNDGKEGAAQGDEVAVDEIVVELQEDAKEQVEENPPQDKVAEEEQQADDEEAPDYSQLKVPELKKLLSERGLQEKGRKADLIKRLEEADAAAPEEEEEDEEEEEMEEEDFSLLRVAELKQRLSALGLPTDGKKAVLVERMQTRPLTASRKGNKA